VRTEGRVRSPGGVARVINEAGFASFAFSFPETAEVVSHGFFPNFSGAWQNLCPYVVHPSCDRPVFCALLMLLRASQDPLRNVGTQIFFRAALRRPPRWLRVHLDKGLSGRECPRLVRQAYEKVAHRP